MPRGTRIALVFAAVPFVTLVLALPFVNRVKPVVLGFPFILFWIVLWVLLTPLFLFLASRVEKKLNPPDDTETP